jgi:hypothetical protein
MTIPEVETPPVVGVLRQHLEEAYENLSRVATYFEALDLSESIKVGSVAPRPSRNAQQLIRARDRLAGYLEVEDELPE